MKKVLIAVLLLFAISGAFAQKMPEKVLFVGVNDNTSDIFIWQNADGEESIRRVTDSPQKEGNACWWPRNSLILASRELAADRYGLVALDLEGKTIWELKDEKGSLGWPVPSPFDDRILCVRGLDNGFVETGIVTFPDGVFEAFDFAGLSGGQLAWLSADEILLSRVTSQGFSISKRNLASGMEEMIVQGGQNWQTHINQLTGRIFFVRRVGQTGSIFELFRDAAGKWEYSNLTNGRVYDWQPSTGDDGKTLIYRSLRDGRFVTVIRDLAGGAEKILNIDGFAQIYFPTILE